MADGINIPITGDASKFLRETDDVEKALDDVADALDDAAKESKDAGRDGEKSFRDLTREVKDTEKQTDKLTDSFDDARRKAKDVGDDGARGLGKVKDGAQEVTQEIGQNLGEAVSSVRGDMGELAQVGQDTLGGLAATLASAGPAGILGAAALAAGATGLGAITASLEEQQEQADRLRERMTAAYQAAAESGRDYLDVAAIIADMNDLISNPEREKEYQQVLETQRLTGLEINTILEANAGQLDAVTEVRGRLQEVIDAEIEKNFEATGAQFQYSRELQRTEDYWRRLGEQADKSSQIAQDGMRYTSDLLLDYIDKAKGAETQTDEFGNKLVWVQGLDDPIVIEAETGRATRDIEKFKGDVDEIPKQKAVTVKGTVDLSAVTRGIRNYRPPTIRVNVKPVGPFGRSAG